MSLVRRAAYVEMGNAYRMLIDKPRGNHISRIAAIIILKQILKYASLECGLN
jgi:hypothetical protein